MRFHGILATLAVVVLMVASIEAKADNADPASQADNDWTFMAAPYLWASGLSGETGMFGTPPQDIDISFGDVLHHLDFGFMGVGEARNGRISLGIDVVYASLSADIDTPIGFLATSIDARTKTFIGTAVVGYDVIEDDASTLDVVAGARLWSVDNEFVFSGGVLGGTSLGDGDTWVDPVVGIKFQTDVGSGFFVAGWGLIGGFGASSDLLWDLMGGLGYHFNDSASLFAGYRVVDVDFESGGFVYDVNQHGPILGGAIRF